MHRYELCGLGLSSPLPLPGWAEFSVPHHAGRPIELRLGAPPSDRQLLQLPLAGGGVLHVGLDVVIVESPQLSPAEVAALLRNWAWPALAILRGWVPLHCSSARVQDSAAVFCGASGAGKSTLAGSLQALGYPVFADDLGICPGDGRMWRASSPILRLCPSAVGPLACSDRAVAHQDKFLVDCADEATPPSLPLRAIYLLEWGPLRVVRLHGVEALRRVVRSATHRPELLQRSGRWPHHWEAVSRMLQTVPVYEFRRPNNWSERQASLELLARHWAS